MLVLAAQPGQRMQNPRIERMPDSWFRVVTTQRGTGAYDAQDGLADGDLLPASRPAVFGPWASAGHRDGHAETGAGRERCRWNPRARAFSDASGRQHVGRMVIAPMCSGSRLNRCTSRPR